MSVNLDLPSPLVLSDARYIQNEYGEFVTATIDFKPEEYTKDSCSNLLIFWAVYNDEYKDNVVQSDKNDSQSKQNGYFVREFIAIESILEGQYKEDYGKIREKQFSGELPLVWWE